MCSPRWPIDELPLRQVTAGQQDGRYHVAVRIRDLVPGPEKYRPALLWPGQVASLVGWHDRLDRLVAYELVLPSVPEQVRHYPSHWVGFWGPADEHTPPLVFEDRHLTLYADNLVVFFGLRWFSRPRKSS